MGHNIQRLRDCQAQLMAVEEEKFPCLYRQVHKTKTGFVAYNIMDAMAQHKRPLYIDASGSGWYAEPLNFLVKTYGGSKETWQSNIILLIEIGLLRRIKPDADTLNPVLLSSTVREYGGGKPRKPCTVSQLTTKKPSSTQKRRCNVGEPQAYQRRTLPKPAQQMR